MQCFSRRLTRSRTARALPTGMLAALSTALLLVVGCDVGPLQPSDGDLIPEMALSGATLAQTWDDDGSVATSPILQAPHGATRVGFMLDVTPAHRASPIRLEARGTDASGDAGAWQPAIVTFSEDLLRVGYIDLDRAAFAVEVRLRSDDVRVVDALIFSAVVPAIEREEPALMGPAPVVDLVSGPASTHQALDIIGVEPRSAWGAAPTRCTSLNTTKTRVSVHHTVTPTTSNGSYAARIRGIQAYHQDSNNWCDIGYHFMVTLDGTTWEAREARFLGSHVGGQNTNNVGVSYVGCFQTAGCNDWAPAVPPQVMIDEGGALIGKIANQYGITVSTSTVMGHRDNPGASTSCPGDNLHARLGDLRDIAAAVTGGGVVPVTTGVLQGVVWDLSVTTAVGESQALGARLPGATITMSDGTVATARAEDAFWSLDLAPGTYTLTARADGYADASREVQVTSGGETWSSMGVAPAPEAVSLRVVVQDADTLVPLPLATVQPTGADSGQTDANGAISFILAPGSNAISVSAEGYQAQTETFAFVSGATEERVFSLLPVVVAEPEAGEPDIAQPEGTPEPEEVPGPEVTFEPSPNPEGNPESDPPQANLNGRPQLAFGCAALALQSTAVPGLSLFLLGFALVAFRRRSTSQR